MQTSILKGVKVEWQDVFCDKHTDERNYRKVKMSCKNRSVNHFVPLRMTEYLNWHLKVVTRELKWRNGF